MSTPDSALREDDEQNKRFGGFSFKRLLAIPILTIVLTVIALVVDELSTLTRNIEYETGDFCEIDGTCGWRTATYDWIEKGEVLNCEATGTTTNINYRTLCFDDNISADCKTMHAGNVYLAFIILSSIVNIFLLTLLVPLCWNKKESIYTKCTHVCNDGGLRNVLQIVFLINTLFLFLSAFIWLILGLCDNALPVYSEIFHYDSMNVLSYSTGAVLICFIANLVAFGAVRWCWGDHQYYEKVQLSTKKQRKTNDNLDDGIDYYQMSNGNK